MDIDDLYKAKDQKIVDGFIRQNYIIANDSKIDIPKDIISLIFLFYHIIIKEFFKHYNPDIAHISDDNMIITRGKAPKDVGSWCVVYGALVIPSFDCGIYQWIFKIIAKKDTLAIGIDDTTYIRKHEGGFANRNGESKCYGLWSDKYRTRWDTAHVILPADNIPEINKDDLVTMTLNLSSKSLSFKINDGNEYTVFEGITTEKDLDYCMAVCTGSKSDCVKLVGCSFMHA